MLYRGSTEYSKRMFILDDIPTPVNDNTLIRGVQYKDNKEIKVERGIIHWKNPTISSYKEGKRLVMHALNII